MNDAAVLKAALEGALTQPLEGSAGGDARPPLSEGQWEILRLVAAGYTNAEIARRRSLTVPAVEKAVARLIKQLDLHASPDTNQRVSIAQAYFRLTGAVSARR